MDFGGITALSQLEALTCPVPMVVGVIARWLPWRTLTAKVWNANSGRMS